MEPIDSSMTQNVPDTMDIDEEYTRSDQCEDVLSNSGCSRDASVSDMMLKLSNDVNASEYPISEQDVQCSSDRDSDQQLDDMSLDQEQQQQQQQTSSYRKGQHTTSEGINIYELGRMLVETRQLKRANGKRAVIKAKKSNVDNGVNATDWSTSEIKEFYNKLKNAVGEWDSNWDKLKKEVGQATNVDAGLGSRLPSASRNIYLVRHGQYHRDKNDDDEDTLTDMGNSQAALTGQRLASFGVTFDRVVHSTMSRAKETAQCIQQHVMQDSKKLEKCDLLREGCPIQPVPKIRGYKPNCVIIHKDEYRIEAAYRKYMHRADVSQRYQTNDILVCHGNVIRYFVCRALQLPTEGWLRLNIQNASITHVVIEGNGKIRIKSYGEAGHLSKSQLTIE